MKRYRLTEPKTLLGILGKLNSVPVLCPGTDLKYMIEGAKIANGLNQSTHIVLSSLQDDFGKPDRLVAILKENRVELKIKQLNPFQKELFDVQEILIEPLERSSARANIQNIYVQNVQISKTVDIGTILSVYGRTSTVTQINNQFQNFLEDTLGSNHYFIKKINVGFFYAASSKLLEYLEQSKQSFFVRDSHKKVFFTETGFFNPSIKMQPKELDSLLNHYLVNNIKSVLIIPFFTKSNTLLGYVEILSNLPNLGNSGLESAIDSPEGLPSLLQFLETSAEEFIFNLELSHTKEWILLSEKEKIRDLSQDGKGLGFYYRSENPPDALTSGSKIQFDIIINQKNYSFFGDIRSWKKRVQETGPDIIGTRIYNSDKESGVELLRAYATSILMREVR
jgi:hypothetical protein